MAGDPTPADLGHQVDRLVIGIHRAVFDQHRNELRALLEPLGAPAPGQLLDVAEFVLEGALTFEVVSLRFRYHTPELLRLDFDEWLRLGVVASAGQPSAEFREVFDTLLAARASTCDSTWCRDEIESPLAGAAKALDHARGSLCELFKGLTEPATPAHRLHHLLTGLRYARMDAHHQAWIAAGLTAAEIVMLTDAAAGNAVDAPLEGLLDRRWLRGDGCITPEGQAARDSIEADTNADCQHLLDAVADQAGWYRALESLSVTP